MALPPFKQSQLGKILLGVSIFFVVLFAITLIMNWIQQSGHVQAGFRWLGHPQS